MRFLVFAAGVLVSLALWTCFKMSLDAIPLLRRMWRRSFVVRWRRDLSRGWRGWLVRRETMIDYEDRGGFASAKKLNHRCHDPRCPGRGRTLHRCHNCNCTREETFEDFSQRTHKGANE